MLRSLAPDMCRRYRRRVIAATYLPTIRRRWRAGCHVLGEAHLQSHRPGGGDGRLKAKEKGVCYGINLNHRFTPTPARLSAGRTKGRAGPPARCRNMSMWTRTAEKLALLPNQGAVITGNIGRHHAPLLR